MSETRDDREGTRMTSTDNVELDELFPPDLRSDAERTRDFWTDLIDNVDDELRVIVAGRHFVAHLFGSPGFGGEAYRVKWLDVERPEVVCNLSFQGVIPDAFRAKLPDNARIRAIPSLRAVGPIAAGVQLAALLDGRANTRRERDGGRCEGAEL